MIYDGSRYQYRSVCSITASDGSVRQTIVHSFPVDERFSYIWHTITEGERIDQIAEVQYGDPLLWWRIADANPEIMWFDNLPAGTRLRIPSGPPTPVRPS